VGLRGPGETQLEVDKRAIRKRITHIKRELEKVEAHRTRYRAQRKRSRIPTVALVGYTNAGKSTLLNRIAKSEVFVADQLFATLDPTTRRVQLPGDDLALFTDTVGFIQKLPTALIAAFHATLEEIAEADLLLHVVDISHPNALNQFQAVQETLAEIDAGHIPMVTALNKADLLSHPENAREILKNFPKAVSISALEGTGIKDLLHLIREELFEAYTPIHVRLPYKQGALISLFHELGQVERVEHERGGMVMQGRIPGRLLAQFAPWHAEPVAVRETLGDFEEDDGLEEE
jgi:GTP-binding protein HflX